MVTHNLFWGGVCQLIDGDNIPVEKNSNHSFQVTTTSNEMEAMQVISPYSTIDLGECETTLKEQNDISDDLIEQLQQQLL